MMTTEELATWRCCFEETGKQRAANSKVGLMNLKTVPGESKYAVAVREGTDLFLVLWVRRNQKGEYFVLKPMSDRQLNLHSNYHRDGTLHHKIIKQKFLPAQKSPSFPIMNGFIPDDTRAICAPKAFTGIVEVASGILGPRHGCIGVALTDLGIGLPDYTWAYQVLTQTVFREVSPHVVISIMHKKHSG
ncbi:MAG: hypothetical protein LZF60_110046 [Nitrospira sp.]|nr:MAG: hypothetical protein LZF60_110046 [Nitrospira sp.]